jgi:DNA-binding XRE family transcriptional regulator
MDTSALQISGFLVSKGGQRVFALVPLESLPEAVDPSPDSGALRVALESLGGVELAPNPIRMARQAAGVSQTALAAAMGVSQPRLSLLERDTAFPSSAAARKALHALIAIKRESEAAES